MTIQRYAVGAALCLLAAPGGVCAQQPAQRQLDSLGAEIRALKARLDSLRSALARAQRAAPVPVPKDTAAGDERSEEHTSELQSRLHLVCRLLLEKKKKKKQTTRV